MSGSDPDPEDLYDRLQKINHQNFEKVHNTAYKERTTEDWEELRAFFDDIMEEANAKKEKDEKDVEDRN